MQPPLWLFAALGSVAMASAGQIFLKLGVRALSASGIALSAPGGVVAAMLQPALIAGVLAFATSMLLWIVAIQGQQLSYVYPLAALGYILVTLLSVAIFGDSLNGWKVGGILLIVVGVGVLNMGRIAVPTSVVEQVR